MRRRAGPIHFTARLPNASSVSRIYASRTYRANRSRRKRVAKIREGYQLPPRRCRGKPHPEPFRGVRLSWSRLFAFGGNTDLKSIVNIRPMCFYCVWFIHNFSWKIHASDRKSYFFNCHVFKIVFKEKKILEWFDNLRLFPKLRRESDRWQVNFNAATLS